MANKHFYDDQPSNSDLLGAEAYVLALLKTINGINNESFSIGITAEWGNGKSTILKLLEKKLEGSGGGVFYIPINLWQYKNSDDIADIFFTELSRRFVEKQKLQRNIENIWTLIKLTLSNFIKSIGLKILSLLLSPLFKEKDTLKLIAEIEKEYTKTKKGREIFDYEEFAKRKTIRDKIDKLVELITKKQKIVIGIDEIDRCSKDMIIKSLDSIRLFLGRNKCIFLLAYDEKVVESAVREKLLKSEGKKEDFLAKRYLEKIIDLVIPIGGFGDYQINNFAKNLQDYEEDSGVIESFVGILDQVDASGKIAEAEGWIGDYLRETPIKNPRTLKRVINLFKFHVIYFTILEDFGLISELKYDALLRITLLKITFGDILKPFFEHEHDYKSFIDSIDSENKNINGLNLDEYEQKVLEYTLGKRRLNELNSHLFFQSYYSPRRINSLKVVKFLNLLKPERYTNNETMLEEFVAFFKENKNEHIKLENQLCYYRHLTKWEKFVDLLRFAKKSESNDFAYLTALYIYFFESYASFNSFKLEIATYDSFISILEKVVTPYEIGNFSSPLPLARYIGIISEAKNYKLLKKAVSAVFDLPDTKFGECISFIKRNVKMTDELRFLIVKGAKNKPEFKTFLDSTFTKKVLFSNYIQKYRTLKSVEYYEKDLWIDILGKF